MIILKLKTIENYKFCDLSNWNGKSRPANTLSRPADKIRKPLDNVIFIAKYIFFRDSINGR